MSEKIVFVNGRGFVKESDLEKESEMSHADESRDRSVIDIMASIQAELNAERLNHAKTLELLNSFRLKQFPENAADAAVGKAYVNEFIVDMLARDETGLNRAELFIKYTRELCAEVSNTVEDFRSKDAIRVKIKKTHADAMDIVTKVRSAPKTVKKGPEKYTTEQKIIANLRKSPITKSMTQTDIVNVIRAMNPGLTEEFIRGEIERQIAKETAAKAKV